MFDYLISMSTFGRRTEISRKICITGHFQLTLMIGYHIGHVIYKKLSQVLQPKGISDLNAPVLDSTEVIQFIMRAHSALRTQVRSLTGTSRLPSSLCSYSLCRPCASANPLRSSPVGLAHRIPSPGGRWQQKRNSTAAAAVYVSALFFVLDLLGRANRIFSSL